MIGSKSPEKDATNHVLFEESPVRIRLGPITLLGFEFERIF